MLTRLFLVGLAFPSVAFADARVSESYGKLPLHFEANQGQTNKDVQFVSRGAGYSLYLTANEAVLVLAKPNPDAKREGPTPAWPGAKTTQVKAVALRMSLVGAVRKPRVSGIDELPGKTNYFIDNNPARWRTHVPTYAKVQYREVYPGIDLVYYGNQRELEHDFVVAPGANPKKIVLDFDGAEKVEINAEGDLVLHTAAGIVRQRRPVIYQKIDGVRREIDGGYVLKGAKRVGFKLATYDRSRPLVIDPILSYSTYLGGSSIDDGFGIAVDGDGNAYVVGSTVSTDFPATAGTFGTSLNGRFDVFVTKLNATGSALVYSTFLGGSGDENGVSIAVDATGAAYVTGNTSSPNFPTTAGAFDTSFNGDGAFPLSDVFVTKLNANGSALVYSTYLGGSGEDIGLGIAVDAAGAAVVTGYSNSLNFPTSPGAFQETSGGDYDAFVTKLDAAGSSTVYSTYLGGGGKDYGRAIAVDANGNAYAAGSTDSINFPTTPGAFRSFFAGGFDDPFVAKLNPAGGLVYSTYLGGSNNDRGSGIAVDGSGNAYVVGSTWSLDFPTTPGAFQPVYGGGPYDGYVAKLNPSGTGLVYATYLGGIGLDYGQSIAVDNRGNAYVAGITYSINFPTTLGAFQPVFGGGSDAYVAKLNPAGSGLVYSTFLGGSGLDYGWGIAADAGGNAYVAGTAGSENFPTTAGAFQPVFGGGGDAFVAKIVDVAFLLPAATGSGTSRSEESAASQIGAWASFGSESGTFSGGTIVAANTAASTAMFRFTGTAVSWIGVRCIVCGVAAVSIDGGTPTTVNTAGPGVPGSLTSEVVFSASGLDPAVTHTLAITVTGTTRSDNAYIAVDAFDVTAGTAASPLLPSVVLPPPPPVVPPLPSPVVPPPPPPVVSPLPSPF
jgi:hypothetical protein